MDELLSRFFRPWSDIFALPALKQSARLGGGPLWSNILTYLALTVVTLVCAFYVSAQIGDTPRTLLLKIYLAGFASVWLAAALALPRWRPPRFLRVTLGVALVSLPSLGMAWALTNSRGSPGWFWMSLILWCSLTVMAVWREGSDDWERLLLVTGALWFVGGFVTTAGTFDLLPYAQRAVAESRTVNALLDFRWVSTFIFTALLIVTAFLRAVGPRIDVPAIRRRYFPSPTASDHILVRALLGPFLVIINLLLTAVYLLRDVAWHLLVVVIVFFRRVGEELVGLVVTLVRKKRVVASLMTVVATYFLLLFLFYTSSQSAGLARVYIDAQSLPDTLSPFMLLLVNTALGTVFVSGLVWLFEKRIGGTLDTSLYSLTFLLSILLVTGLVMWGLSHAGVSGATRFSNFGLMSVLLCAFVVTGVLYRGATKGLAEAD